MNDWKAVAARLGSIGRSTVFHLWASGELRSVKIGKRRFSTDRQVSEYIDRLESAAGVLANGAA
ncbi:hypothetical protein [Mycobacteroides abscessus]|uniref:hypothetical protein n=1 Tax=Mycobacteroides abscessus TaxID=36809 RepID=UPI00266EADED|nr:hypothetical protein [Mycobacteroides abscessus]MDO3110284.1 hypothetical protein [Mycobacteroides abscessus subsp. abscessus]